MMQMPMAGSGGGGRRRRREEPEADDGAGSSSSEEIIDPEFLSRAFRLAMPAALERPALTNVKSTRAKLKIAFPQPSAQLVIQSFVCDVLIHLIDSLYLSAAENVKNGTAFLQ